MNGVITERFLYKDQLEPVAKIDGNGDILELYIYGEKGHVPGYIVKGGQTYRVISDHLGSVRMIVNANTGDIAQEITYNEFGIVLIDTNPGFQPFYFAGGIYDLDTKLVKFGARDYDSETGRWISKEPLGFAGSNNFYSYVNGDPVNFVDVTGLKLIFVGTATEQAFVTIAIARLEQYSPTAKLLIELLEDTDYDIYILNWSINNNMFAPCERILNSGKKEKYAALFYNPQYWGEIYTRPPEIGLAHEMVHALHYFAGTVGGETEKMKRLMKHLGVKYNYAEEGKTVGLGIFSDLGFTENQIRSEYRRFEKFSWIPVRTRYGTNINNKEEAFY